MRAIPHQISLYGRIYDVKWGSAKEPDWDPSTQHSLVIDGYTRKGQESYAIILNPSMKGDSQIAFESLLHEVIHVMNWRERAWRKEHPTERTDKSARARFRPLTHPQMHSLDMALARILFENGALFQCICRRCRKGGRVTGKINHKKFLGEK